MIRETVWKLGLAVPLTSAIEYMPEANFIHPLEIIEQITYLLFLKRLDELETAA